MVVFTRIRWYIGLEEARRSASFGSPASPRGRATSERFWGGPFGLGSRVSPPRPIRDIPANVVLRSPVFFGFRRQKLLSGFRCKMNYQAGSGIRSIIFQITTRT